MPNTENTEQISELWGSGGMPLGIFFLNNAKCCKIGPFCHFCQAFGGGDGPPGPPPLGAACVRHYCKQDWLTLEVGKAIYHRTPSCLLKPSGLLLQILWNCSSWWRTGDSLGRASTVTGHLGFQNWQSKTVQRYVKIKVIIIWLSTYQQIGCIRHCD